MEATVGKFFESIGSFFSSGDQIPWSDRDVILGRDMLFKTTVQHSMASNGGVAEIKGCEREVAEASISDSEERKNESIMSLSWALVHSSISEDVQRGIAMLQTSLGNSNSSLHQREKLYLLAVGYYRSNAYSRCRQILDQCLEIAPDWRQALSLKKTVEDKIAKDGVIGIGITATAVVIAGGIVAALTRKN